MERFHVVEFMVAAAGSDNRQDVRRCRYQVELIVVHPTKIALGYV